jgi:hypothetical protein
MQYGLCILNYNVVLNRIHLLVAYVGSSNMTPGQYRLSPLRFAFIVSYARLTFAGRILAWLQESDSWRGCR